MLCLSSSTLACNAADACLYSSSSLYAANEDARENPKRKPITLTCHGYVNIGEPKGMIEDSPAANSADWLFWAGGNANMRRSSVAENGAE